MFLFIDQLDGSLLALAKYTAVTSFLALLLGWHRIWSSRLLVFNVGIVSLFLPHQFFKLLIREFFFHLMLTLFFVRVEITPDEAVVVLL